MLLATGVKNIIACDENGILYKDRGVGIKDHKKMLCDITNLEDKRGTLADALVGADVFMPALSRTNTNSCCNFFVPAFMSTIFCFGFFVF